MAETYKPKPYMKKAIKFGVERACAGFFLDPGLGKTAILYMIMNVLLAKRYVRRALVVAPLRPASSVWPRERDKWEEFKHLRVRVLHGPNKVALASSPHDVSVINPEGLDWLFDWAIETQSAWPWDMLVIDESTRFKHTNTARFKTLKKWLSKFKRRYILTGSPAPNGLMDLYGQIYLLDGGLSLGRFITEYRREFFDRTGFGGFHWKLKDGAEEEIYKRLRKLVIRMSAEDYLNLEPYIANYVNITLPEQAQDVYDNMEALLIASINDRTITAASAGTASMKCRQIANGGIFADKDWEKPHAKEWELVHNAKTEAVEEIVEELGGKPAFVAYEFHHDLQRLQKAFPDAPYLGGGVTLKRQREIEDAWNRGELPVLLAQPQSVAHGLNLQGTGAAVIWHSLTWDLENYEQLIRRVWRQGQKERVVVHHIVANGTVDEAIIKAIGKKDRTQRALLSALKDYAVKKERR